MTNWWNGMGAYVTTAYFQGGVRLDRIATRYPVHGARDQWLVATAADSSVVTFAELAGTNGLRPLAVETLLGRGVRGDPQLYWTWPFSAGPMLEAQAQRLEHSAHCMLESNCIYILRALLYHLRLLTKGYGEVLASVSSFETPGERESHGFATVEPYFEFEALVTALVRFYETLRYSLWKHFGIGSAAPRNFSDVVGRLRVSDKRLRAVLDEALENYEETKRYRDCIQHNAHFGAAWPFVMIDVLPAGISTARARLPDNPEAKSYRKFTYAKEADALEFSYTHVNKCFVTAHEVWQQIESSTVCKASACPGSG